MCSTPFYQGCDWAVGSLRRCLLLIRSRATIQLNAIYNNTNLTDRRNHWATLFSRVTFVSDRSHNRVTVLRQTIFNFWQTHRLFQFSSLRYQQRDFEPCNRLHLASLKRVWRRSTRRKQLKCTKSSFGSKVSFYSVWRRVALKCSHSTDGRCEFLVSFENGWQLISAVDCPFRMLQFTRP